MQSIAVFYFLFIL